MMVVKHHGVNLRVDAWKSRWYRLIIHRRTFDSWKEVMVLMVDALLEMGEEVHRYNNPVSIDGVMADCIRWDCWVALKRILESSMVNQRFLNYPLTVFKHHDIIPNKTPLVMAIEQGSRGSVRVLVAHLGRRVNPPSLFFDWIHWPLWGAVMKGSTEFVELLLASNHPVRLRNTSGSKDAIRRLRGITPGEWEGDNDARQAILTLLERYDADPVGVRREAQAKHDMPPSPASVMFAAIVLGSDEYLGLGAEGLPTHLPLFWRLVQRLPQPLQMQICCRLDGLNRLLTTAEIEHAARYVLQNK